MRTRSRRASRARACQSGVVAQRTCPPLRAAQLRAGASGHTARAAGARGVTRKVLCRRALLTMLARLTGNTWSGTWIQLFLVASLVSSYIGILLSLFHFIQDGLKLTNRMGHRIVLTLITLAPPWLFGQYYPHGFLIALTYAGLFVCILNVVLPVVMVSLLRYRKMATTYRAPGGWWGIYFCSIIVFVFILYEVTRIQTL